MNRIGESTTCTMSKVLKGHCYKLNFEKSKSKRTIFIDSNLQKKKKNKCSFVINNCMCAEALTGVLY